MRRYYGWLWLCVFALLVGMLISVFQNRLPPPLQPSGQPLEVHFIDVGQGDSIFLRAPDGTTALIDGGPTSSDTLGYLQRQGITRLDMVIISHPHADHIGGLISVLSNLPVGGVWTNGASHATGTFERLLGTIEKRRIPYHEVGTSQSIPFSDLNFSVLYGIAKHRNLNNTSLVLRLNYGQTSFLFTGDAEKAVEKTLLSTSADVLPATVLKIAHHGSKTSSSPAFVQAVSPQIAVYSAGDNYYDHPNQTTLNTFAALNIPVYGTDELGTIVVRSNGETVTLVSKSGMVMDTNSPYDLPFNVTPIYATPFSVQDIAVQDIDCGHFATHEEAQTFFTAQGGPLNDPHRLDGNNDGMACESLP